MAITLDKLQQHIEMNLPPHEVQSLKKFAEVLFDKATPEFLEDFDEQGLLAVALGAQKMVRQVSESITDSSRGVVQVRVFNPDLERDGWVSSEFTAVELCLRDRPFIVDSAQAELKRLNLRVHSFLHPILHVGESEGASSGPCQVAYELYLIQRVDEEERLDAIAARLRAVLADVVVATDDYAAMRAQSEKLKHYLVDLYRAQENHNIEQDLKECEAFVVWLTQGNFVFLGYREYNIFNRDGESYLQVVQEAGLGIRRDVGGSSYREPVPIATIPNELRIRVTGGPLLIVTKSNAESTVHRPVRMDYIGIKKWGPNREVQGEMRLLGLLTSKALSTPVKEIPILRRKLQRVLELDNAIEGSHDFKQIVSIFNSMPREELFWSNAESLHQDIRAIIAMQIQHKVRVIFRADPLARGLQAMVIMPKGRFNGEVRHLIQDLLTKRFEATHVDYQLSIGEEEDQVRFHFFFITNVLFQSLDLGALENQVVDLTRTWFDRLSEKLSDGRGPAEAAALAQSYSEAFPDAYSAATPVELAVGDINHLELLRDDTRHFAVDLVNAWEDSSSQPVTELRIYHSGQAIYLSDVLPVLENLGLRVVMQANYWVRAEGRDAACIDIFRVLNKWTLKPLDIDNDRDRLIPALVDLLDKNAENDRLNGLILSTTLTLRQIALLRSYQVYYWQINPNSSRHFLNEVLLATPWSSQILYEYFAARFDPDPGDREATVLDARERFFESLNTVTTLAHDRTLRDLFNLVDSTIRTNFFLGKLYISHKINSHKVKVMPEPRPLVEIVVTAPGVDGIHLRGGKVARGGLRWSDRPDFRTEVLGLMKTQMTKNAVIVPVGSKGGFALKHAPRDRDQLRALVVEQYKIFIRGLLDLTDNIVAGNVVHPEGLVIYDEADPYLVVAADKGTATFSDIANSVSAEYDFWLGDAFASGGSQGYDHKKEGITARGAWEGVKRHFREMGVNVLTQEITVAGIGDLAGDVFGNGLIYCDTLRLQAAFNHLHIFLDPNPDAKASFAERVRMFNLPRSSWDDYDKSLISQGGGIFLRGAKSIELSPEVKAILGVAEDALSGEDLVKAILRMPVDLLWNGGIGTYVKASSERHADVGDSSNDSVRIDAPELRAKVIGEGGNQGFTQLGRIELARRGGRINTDAIDNSAGVDMSDHEVNIKILLGQMVAAGHMTMEQRNSVLVEMTQEVSQLVLKDNYNQTMSLSMSERRSRTMLQLFTGLMDYLAERGGLRLDVEFLPDHKSLAERVRSGEGLTRPELAILMAYTKMGLYRRILETDFPNEAYFQHFLVDYFPTAIRERYREQVLQHQLVREITATQFTNVVVDLLGMTFVQHTIQDTGATPIQVIRASLSALEIVEAASFMERLAALDNQVNPEHLYEAHRSMTRAVENAVNWMLLADVDLSSLSDFIGTYRTALGELLRNLRRILPSGELQRFEALQKQALDRGFPEDMADSIASFEWVPSGMAVIETGRRADMPPETAARRYYELGERFSLSWLRTHLGGLVSQDKWERIAVVGLTVELRRIQLQLVLSNQQFPSVDGGLVARYDQALEEIRAESNLNLASGDVLARMLNQMAQGAHSHDPVTLAKQPALPGVRTRRGQ